MLPTFRVLIPVLLSLSATIGCAHRGDNPAITDRVAAQHIGAAVARKKPKLVLVVISDGFRADYLGRFSDLFTGGGLHRLMDRGAWFRNAEHNHSTTYTAVGHASILTGASPRFTGTIANDWHDRALDDRMYCVEDRAVQAYANGTPVAAHAGSSPNNLVGTTVGDRLILSRPDRRSKVISLSIKDRGAILTGGKHGRSFWYHPATGDFVTSRYYHRENPAWLDEFNSRGRAESYVGRVWDRVLPVGAYVRSARDERVYETNYKKLGITFPHVLTAGPSDTASPASPGPDFFKMLRFTPFGDSMLLELAMEVISAEQLGQRGDTDLLSISLSSVDYVGHAFGPYSHELQDTVLRLDQGLESFFEFLDSEIGMDDILVVFTSDHGMMPIPEYAREFGLDAGRIDPAAMEKAIDVALDQVFGADDWVIKWWNPNLYLNHETIAKHGLSHAEVETAAADFLRTYPGAALTFTRTQMLDGSAGDTELGQRMMTAFNEQRSGDVFLVQKPNWYLFEAPDTYATTHGSPYEYDRRVPLILSGPGIKPGVHGGAVSVYDIAPTLAEILGVEAPNPVNHGDGDGDGDVQDPSQGRVLREALE